MAGYGRQSLWIPNDLMETLRVYQVKLSNRMGGKYVTLTDALIAILDEWDVMCDAKDIEERLTNEH